MPKRKKVSDNPAMGTTPHTIAFSRLPQSIQDSRPMDYRFVDYDYLSFKVQQLGIKSVRQYKSFVTVMKPAGFPYKPDQTYDEWDSWTTFLTNDNGYYGTAESSIKSGELLPFWDAVALIQSKQYATRDAFYEAWEEGRIPKGIPKRPGSRYPEFHRFGGWMNFLGKKLSHRVNAKVKIESVCALSRTVDDSANTMTLIVAKNGITELRDIFNNNKHMVALKVFYWYNDYAPHVISMLDTLGRPTGAPNQWIFNDPNTVFYEMADVLEIYNA